MGRQVDFLHLMYLYPIDIFHVKCHKLGTFGGFWNAKIDGFRGLKVGKR